MVHVDVGARRGGMHRHTMRAGSGELDREWTPGVVRAMRSFANANANANAPSSI